MTQPPKPPVPRSPRYESLDFWRGVACLMIVVVHSVDFRYDELPAGATASSMTLVSHIGWHGVILDKVTRIFNIGVSIFFVISGYCIAASCDSSRRKPRALGSFYFRRFRRIFPPYWIYLVLFVLFFMVVKFLKFPESPLTTHGHGLPKPLPCSIWELIGSFTLTSTWLGRFVGDGGMISGQAWSLCYEEQFYFVAGLLLWLVPHRFFAGVAVITAAVLALFVAGQYYAIDLHGFFFDGFWLLFGAGVLVYFRCNYQSGRSALATDLLLFTGFVAFAVIRPQSRWFDIWFFPAGFAFALLLCWLHRWDARIASISILLPIVFCGRMCYSLYLVHVPVVLVLMNWLSESGVRGYWPTMLVTVPLCVVTSVTVAHVFATFVERRFLNPTSKPVVDRIPTGISSRLEPGPARAPGM